ncbi:MAG: hypothetical protein GXO63_03080 [Candidatus Micrarchaeota archaeon]|nr:hypothetical protein [Candidatus Micrarchaeota archaeon]
MKGQYLVLEHVFFFLIGVIMTIVIFYTFSGIADNIREGSFRYQLLRVAETLRWDIVEAYLAGKETGAIITIKRDIPTEIAGCLYSITASENLTVKCIQTGESESLPLFNISVTVTNQIIYSSSGIIIITYEGDEIWLS